MSVAQHRPSGKSAIPQFVDASKAPRRLSGIGKPAKLVACVVVLASACVLVAMKVGNRDAVNHRERVFAVIDSLKKIEPSIRSAPYNGTDDTINLDADFETLKVASVSLNKVQTRVIAYVSLFGIAEKPVKPEVNVTLFDEHGTTLAHQQIAIPPGKLLLPRKTLRVSVELDIPPASFPAVIGVDDNADARLARANNPPEQAPVWISDIGPKPELDQDGFARLVLRDLVANHVELSRCDAQPLERGSDAWEQTIIYTSPDPDDGRLRYHYKIRNGQVKSPFTRFRLRIGSM